MDLKQKKSLKLLHHTSQDTDDDDEELCHISAAAN